MTCCSTIYKGDHFIDACSMSICSSSLMEIRSHFMSCKLQLLKFHLNHQILLALFKNDCHKIVITAAHSFFLVTRQKCTFMALYETVIVLTIFCPRIDWTDHGDSYQGFYHRNGYNEFVSLLFIPYVFIICHPFLEIKLFGTFMLKFVFFHGWSVVLDFLTKSRKINYFV